MSFLLIKNTVGVVIGHLDFDAVVLAEGFTKEIVDTPPDGTVVVPPATVSRLLAYAQNTAFTPQTTQTIDDCLGLSITINVLEGQVVKLSAYQPAMSCFVTTDRSDFSIWEGDTQIQCAQGASTPVGVALSPSIVLMPSPGQHTFRARFASATGTNTMICNVSSSMPSYIMAELL